MMGARITVNLIKCLKCGGTNLTGAYNEEGRTKVRCEDCGWEL